MKEGKKNWKRKIQFYFFFSFFILVFGYYFWVVLLYKSLSWHRLHLQLQRCLIPVHGLGWEAQAHHMQVGMVIGGICGWWVMMWLNLKLLLVMENHRGTSWGRVIHGRRRPTHVLLPSIVSHVGEPRRRRLRFTTLKPHVSSRFPPVSTCLKLIIWHGSNFFCFSLHINIKVFDKTKDVMLLEYMYLCGAVWTVKKWMEKGSKVWIFILASEEVRDGNSDKLRRISLTLFDNSGGD